MSRLPTLALAALLALGLAGCDGTDEPTIADEDLQATPQDVDGDEEPSQEPVSDSEEPAPEASEEVTPAPPTFEEACAGRDDEAFIEVLTPQADAEVDQEFTVTGCGNTFEANYIWRVEDTGGEVLADGFGTMSCGNGCVGEFEQDVTLETTGEVTLVVFEESARDGTPQHVVEVPLTVG